MIAGDDDKRMRRIMMNFEIGLALVEPDFPLCLGDGDAQHRVGVEFDARTIGEHNAFVLADRG